MPARHSVTADVAGRTRGESVLHVFSRGLVVAFSASDNNCDCALGWRRASLVVRLHHPAGSITHFLRRANVREDGAPAAWWKSGRLEHMRGVLPGGTPGRLSLRAPSRDQADASPAGHRARHLVRRVCAVAADRAALVVDSACRWLTRLVVDRGLDRFAGGSLFRRGGHWTAPSAVVFAERSSFREGSVLSVLGQQSGQPAGSTCLPAGCRAVVEPRGSEWHLDGRLCPARGERARLCGRCLEAGQRSGEHGGGWAARAGRKPVVAPAGEVDGARLRALESHARCHDLHVHRHRRCAAALGGAACVVLVVVRRGICAATNSAEHVGARGDGRSTAGCRAHDRSRAQPTGGLPGPVAPVCVLSRGLGDPHRARQRSPRLRASDGILSVGAVGGMLGGLFNTLLAPIVFTTGILEYPIALVLACLLRANNSRSRTRFKNEEL